MTLHATGTHAGAAAGTALFALNSPGLASPAPPRRSEEVFTTALCLDDLVSADHAVTMSDLPTTMCSGGSGLCQNAIVANKIVAAEVEPPARRGAQR